MRKYGRAVNKFQTAELNLRCIQKCEIMLKNDIHDNELYAMNIGEDVANINSVP
jgi:hypothetical protein